MSPQPSRIYVPVALFGLMAQTQSTFYAAFEDGREAERQGQWRSALSAYHRAVALRPVSAGQAIIYGNNLLKDYYPYTRMARCHLELKEWEAAEAQLAKAVAMHEAQSEINDLARRLREARAHSIEPAPDAPKPGPTGQVPQDVPPALNLGPAEGKVESPRKDPAPPNPFPSVGAPRLSPPSIDMGRSVHPALEIPPHTKGAPPPSVSSTIPMDHGQRVPVLWISAGLALSGLFVWMARRRKTALQPSSSFRDPERMGPYRVERLLGRGGFASTFLAHHERTGQAVALKVLHPYRHDDPEFLGRFRLEARLGVLLDHPNLVRMVEIGPEDGPAWLAMEYVPGERLDQFLKGRGPLPLKEALSITLQIASAMAHAHGHGIVHRDLKPSNIMYGEGRVRVMDFGISRVMDSETLTTTYAFLGTPLYAAPEAQLKTQVGPTSDRYSLGIMLFEMLAGQTPFMGETPFDILDHHRCSPLPDLDALRQGLPPELVSLVLALCAKDPDKRPEDDFVIRRLTEILRND